jgi:hypothetical protein
LWFHDLLSRVYRFLSTGEILGVSRGVVGLIADECCLNA